MHGQTKTVTHLISRGPMIEEKDDFGQTALHLGNFLFNSDLRVNFSIFQINFNF